MSRQKDSRPGPGADPGAAANHTDTQPSGAPPFRLQRLDHLVLRARNPDLLVRFYCEVLGCRIEREVASVGLVQLRAGDSLIDVVSTTGEIGLSGGEPPQPGGGHNLDHFCLQVAPFEAEALAAHLARHGVRSSRVRDLYGAEGIGPSIYIQDPEGNRVELKGPARQAHRGAD